MQRTFDFKNNSNELVAVHVDELYQAWKSGLVLFVEDLDKDPDRKTEVLTKVGKFSSELRVETMSEILSGIESKKP